MSLLTSAPTTDGFSKHEARELIQKHQAFADDLRKLDFPMQHRGYRPFGCWSQSRFPAVMGCSPGPKGRYHPSHRPSLSRRRTRWDSATAYFHRLSSVRRSKCRCEASCCLFQPLVALLSKCLRATKNIKRFRCKLWASSLAEAVTLKPLTAIPEETITPNFPRTLKASPTWQNWYHELT